MIKKLIVVGGGTAGLISAMILKTRLPLLEIEIIKSDQIGIIGVGEGTTEHFKEFMNVCNISEKELIQKTDATFKYGVMFQDWTSQDYLQFPDLNHRWKIGPYEAYYAYNISHNISFEQMMEKNLWNKRLTPGHSCNQYHFNTFKLNDFLLDKAAGMEIKITEDKIKSVSIKDGIDILQGEKRKYQADFYIDATGFKRLLVSKLGARWESFNLPMNEAIAFQTPDTENYNTWTLAKAMTAGWLWRIPTYGRWGNGYVYDNHYMNKEKAQKEVEKYLGHSITISKHLKFDAGALKQVWIKNCVAIGLSATFAEPLEASSIGTTIQQAFLLSHYLINSQDTDKSMYNEKCNAIFKNTRDFIGIHYLVKRKERFWREVKIKFSDDFNIKLKRWKKKLPMDLDFDQEYVLFRSINFLLVLWGINHFNRKTIKNEFKYYGKKVEQEIIKQIKKNKQYNFLPALSHKSVLENIKGHYVI